jgi:hypothetical protein
MPSLSLSPWAALPVRRPLLLAFVALVLVVAVVVVPGVIASVPSGGDVGSAFSRWWASGDGSVHGELARSADGWARFHVAKALVAAMLLVVLAWSGAWAWVGYAKAERRSRRVVLGAVGTVCGVLALVAYVFVIANIQGAVAPLSSLLSMLPVSHPGPAVVEVRHGLAGGSRSPALQTLVHDFAVYHAVMAGLAAFSTAAFLGAAVALWRRRAGAHRRLLTSGATVAALLALSFAVLTAANLSTALDAAPALAMFFGGA